MAVNNVRHGFLCNKDEYLMVILSHNIHCWPVACMLVHFCLKYTPYVDFEHVQIIYFRLLKQMSRV